MPPQEGSLQDKANLKHLLQQPLFHPQQHLPQQPLLPKHCSHQNSPSNKMMKKLLKPHPAKPPLPQNHPLPSHHFH
ncbi:hypothetical protein HanIR_Chr16g0834151 [Helianthus annuus]|nr:hypothetical protein HanIR_Chr16g0834151 [Helianthus annuus]